MTQQTSIDGFILCGGKATRLKGINGNLPKCLLKVHGRSVLGHLIHWLSPRLDRITVSYSRDHQVYLDCLKDELDDAIFAQLRFEDDPHQEGTALAVQRHDARPDRALTVINGDTLYDDFSAVVPAVIGGNEIVFSTSYQPVDRGGEVVMNTATGTIDYFKNRDGGVAHEGWVTNGILTLGVEALQVFQSLPLEVGVGLEDCLLDLQHDERVAAVLHETAAIFMDIGVPEEFLNADERFRRLSEG